MFVGQFQSYDIPFDTDCVSMKVRIQFLALLDAEKKEELKKIEIVVTHSDIVEDWFMNKE